MRKNKCGEDDHSHCLASTLLPEAELAVPVRARGKMDGLDRGVSTMMIHLHVQMSRTLRRRWINLGVSAMRSMKILSKIYALNAPLGYAEEEC